MAAPLRTLCCTALRHSSRCFTTTCGTQAGIKWRTENGLARSGTEYGPMTDLPDWSFAANLKPQDLVSLEEVKGQIDEQMAGLHPLKGQLRRKQERETLARRVVNLSSEVDKGMEVWREKHEEAKRMQERNKSLLLKPKGNLLLKKNK